MYGLVVSILIVSVVLNLPDSSLACNGFEFKLLNFHECNDKNIIKFKGPNTKLDNQCDVIPEGCIHTEGYKTAMLKYRIEKKPLPVIEGELDLCHGMKDHDEDAALILSFLNLPETCPVEKFEKCAKGEKQMNIDKHKHKLGFGLGIITTNVTIVHDNGETCLSVQGELKKVTI